jgi:hypothetical protein
MASRFARPDNSWPVSLATSAQRVQDLTRWDDEKPCPRRRLIEAWTIAVYGSHMAATGGFRLAFWREDSEHHGPRLDRALARYGRCATVRPTGFPAAAVAAFAHFLVEHTARQPDDPEHGMAYDVQRFSELTKQMRAYATTPVPIICGWPAPAPTGANMPAGSPMRSTRGWASGSPGPGPARRSGSPASCSSPTTSRTGVPPGGSTPPPSATRASRNAIVGCVPDSPRL